MCCHIYICIYMCVCMYIFITWCVAMFLWRSRIIAVSANVFCCLYPTINNIYLILSYLSGRLYVELGPNNFEGSLGKSYMLQVPTSWWRHQMETFSALLALCGESTSHRCIPLTKASDAERGCLFLSALQQTVEHALETPMIWDAIALIMTSLWFWTKFDIYCGLGNFVYFLHQGTTVMYFLEPSFMFVE